MSTNCLVTKLRESVDNKMLPKIGSMFITIELNKNVEYIGIAKPYYNTTDEVSLSVVDGNCFLSESADAATGVQEIAVKAAEHNQVVYVHGTAGSTVVLSINNYYNLFLLDVIQSKNQISNSSKVTIDESKLKYSKIAQLFINTKPERKLNISNLTLESLVYFGGKINFNSSVANSQHTPDVYGSTLYETVDDAINSLIYFKDKYNRFYNGPYYSVTATDIPFSNLPSDKKVSIYEALLYPLMNRDSDNNLRQIFFLNRTYTISNDNELLDNGVVVPNPAE